MEHACTGGGNIHSKMAPSSVASLFFCLLLLLPAHHGASSHASYKVGSRQVSFKTPGRSQQASRVPSATTCSSISTGLGNNKLPVVHRQSPCSPLHRLPSLTSAEALRRDTSLLRRRRFSSRSPSSSSTVASSSLSSAAPSPSPSSISIPVNASSDYTVLVGYGTPGQQLPVFLDTATAASVLWCKPCPSVISGDCDPAFDTTRSSTFAHVPCGSPECPVNCSGAVCPLFYPRTADVLGTFATDVLTLAPSSAAVPGFLFACLNLPEHNGDMLPAVGTIDLSRDRNSLPSRLSSSPYLPEPFSYCLPQSPTSMGFLSFGAGVGSGAAEVHAPLVSNHGGDPVLASMYFIDLVGMSLGGEDLPILASSFGANGTNLDVGTTFALLPPAAYAPLRDAFREDMAKYNPGGSPLPGFHAGFDTCYNFTGLGGLVMPLIELKFGNGDSLVIDQDQMLYYDDPDAAPFTVACLAFSAEDDDGGDDDYAVIGSYTLASTEVVYDVVGGKVGFTPHSC